MLIESAGGGQPMGWPLLGLCHVVDKERLISVNCCGMFFSDKGPSSSALW